jgi:hypothetical protein
MHNGDILGSTGSPRTPSTGVARDKGQKLDIMDKLIKIE